MEWVSTEVRRLPGRAEGGVGGTVSGDRWWLRAWISESEASSAKGLADSWAVCLEL